jgi:hypothetical protein
MNDIFPHREFLMPIHGIKIPEATHKKENISIF